MDNRVCITTGTTATRIPGVGTIAFAGMGGQEWAVREERVKQG